MIPLLVLWAGLGQRAANATSLVAIIPIAIAAVPIYYFRQGGAPDVDLRIAVFLVIGSVVGAYLGARALKRIPERQLRIGVAIAMVLVGLKQLVLP